MKTSTITPSFSNTYKKLFCLLSLLTFYLTSAQTSVMVNYTTTSAAFPNPERGFYHHTSTHSNSYKFLNQSTLAGYRNANITLILRLFYLDDFLNAPISSTYLNNIQTDFNTIRSAGIKCVLRFAYKDDTSGQLDAPKAVMLNHIAQIKTLLTNNADIIACVQAGFIGAWGEWYYTTYYGMPPNQTDYANRKEIADAILAAIPNRMIEIRTPSLKQKTYNAPNALTDSQAFDGTNIARVGHHNDCFLASSSDFGTYTDPSKEYPYLSQETKYTPMGGETCAVNEPRSKCATALDELSKFHWSYLNTDYNPDVIGGFQSESCYGEIQNRLGYRFELVSGVFPKSLAVGGALPITLNIKNSGFSALFNQRTAYLVLRNSSTNQEFSIPLKSDPRFWSGGATQAITENLTLPTNMPVGDYKFYLSLPDTDSALKIRPEYSIRFANENLWETKTGYNNLLYTVTVQPALGLDDINKKLDLVIYTVPGADEMVAEMDGINDYNVSLFNTLGQKISTYISTSENKMILDTQSLSSGVYILQFENGKTTETRKISVNH